MRRNHIGHLRAYGRRFLDLVGDNSNSRSDANENERGGFNNRHYEAPIEAKRRGSDICGCKRHRWRGCSLYPIFKLRHYLAVVILHDEAGIVGLIDGPRWREAASSSKTRVRLTERRHNSHRFFLFGRLEGGRLFHAHAIKHARENRNVGLVLDQRTEMIGVK